MKTFGQRLKKAIEFENMSQTDFSRVSDISPTHLSKFINDERSPSLENVQKIVRVTNAWFCSDWLLVGKGERP